jgi:hypothetical protein
MSKYVVVLCIIFCAAGERVEMVHDNQAILPLFDPLY